jgi:hypothetical protein
MPLRRFFGAVLRFGAVWFRMSMPTFRRDMLFPSSGRKWQGWEVVSLYRTSGAKAEREGSESWRRIGYLPSVFISQILFKPYAFQPCHSSPEDGDSMFLRNVGVYIRNHTARKPKRTPTFCFKIWQVWVISQSKRLLSDSFAKSVETKMIWLLQTCLNKCSNNL